MHQNIATLKVDDWECLQSPQYLVITKGICTFQPHFTQFYVAEINYPIDYAL